ncbi:hypothetical protein ACLOJK_031590, partial [Asimina triloba]
EEEEAEQQQEAGVVVVVYKRVGGEGGGGEQEETAEMKGSVSIPVKRGWRGLVILVLALVFLSMTVPLSFMFGPHNNRSQFDLSRSALNTAPDPPTSTRIASIPRFRVVLTRFDRRIEISSAELGCRGCSGSELAVFGLGTRLFE